MADSDAANAAIHPYVVGMICFVTNVGANRLHAHSYRKQKYTREKIRIAYIYRGTESIFHWADAP